MPKEKTQKHICGKCGEQFDSEEEYCNHECKETGFKPTDIEHQGEEFKAVSEAALKRGEERKSEEK